MLLLIYEFTVDDGALSEELRSSLLIYISKVLRQHLVSATEVEEEAAEHGVRAPQLTRLHLGAAAQSNLHGLPRLQLYLMLNVLGAAQHVHQL